MRKNQQQQQLEKAEKNIEGGKTNGKPCPDDVMRRANRTASHRIAMK